MEVKPCDPSARGLCFWAAEIDPKVLLAMATRAGGEKIADLDAVAPRVDPPGAKPELKTEAKPGEPAAPAAKGGPIELAPAPRAK